MTADALEATAPLESAVRTGLVRGLAQRRAEDVLVPHREEIDHLLDRTLEAEHEDVATLAFFDALSLASYAGRRPEP